MSCTLSSLTLSVNVPIIFSSPGFLKKLFYFILFYFFGCVGSSLLWAFSSCGEQGLLFIAVHGLLIEVTSLVAEHGL